MPESGGSGLNERLAELAAEAAAGDDETWHLSRRPLARGTTAFVVGTLRDAGTLGEAMRRIARAYNVIHGGDFNRVEERADRLSYRIEDAGFPYDARLSAAEMRATMEAVLVFVHAMLSLVAGRDLRDRLLGVSSRAPRGGAEFWPVAVRGGASAYRLDYDPRVAALPVAAGFAGFGQEEVFDEAIRQAGQERRADADLTGRVRAALARGLNDQEAVARSLGLSVATLRRRLDEAGTGFRALKADALNAQAMRLLALRHASADVAEALGFADGRSFARAFKAWNGVSPARFRAGACVGVSEYVPVG